MSGDGFQTTYWRLLLWLRSPLKHTLYLLCSLMLPRISPYSLESNDPTLKMALCGRINTCMTLLATHVVRVCSSLSGCDLVASLTVDSLPVSSPRFEPECTKLCHYCIALIQTLSELGFAFETEKHLSWLLYDLSNFFAVEM